MAKFFTTVLFFIAAGLIGISQAFFTVDQTEQAIILQFGQPIGEADDLVKKPGIHLKVPFIQTVRYFDSRLISVDPKPERMNISSAGTGSAQFYDKEPEVVAAEGEEATAEDAKEVEVQQTSLTIGEGSGEPILVDTYARYRITDPLAFLKTMRTIENANARIEDIMSNTTRNVLGKTTLRDILSERRTAIMNRIRQLVNEAMVAGGFGIEIVDTRIVRADLTDKLRTSTVNRMITELRERATETRAKGKEQALRIRSTAEKQKTVLLANAERDAQIMRGEGDKEAISIYAKAFNADPDFYSFIRSMEAYGTTLSDDETQLILSPDSAFLKFFKDQSAR